MRLDVIGRRSLLAQEGHRVLPVPVSLQVQADLTGAQPRRPVDVEALPPQNVASRAVAWEGLSHPLILNNERTNVVFLL